jgi:hypothetical protein
MTDDQCTAIVDVIKELTAATREVAENISSIWSYDDEKLVKQVNLVAQMVEDISIKI